MNYFGSSKNVNITNCTFYSNSAAFTGGAVMFQMGSQDVVSICITYCTFHNNSASYGGGAVILIGSQGNVSITYCTFQNNSAAYAGGGVLFCLSSGNVDITNCIFTKNTADYGAAVTITKIYQVQAEGEPLGHLLLLDVVIKDNHSSRGGAIFFDAMKVDIFGNTSTGSQFSSNSALGAIQGQNGLLLLHGNITFTANRGVNGGAINLYNNVSLYFYEGCRVEFSRNVATEFGGATTMIGAKKALYV